MENEEESVRAVLAGRLGLLVAKPGMKKKLIAASGIAPSSFDRLLRGSNDPQTSSLVRLAEAAGVSLDWLTGLTDDPTPAALLKHERGVALDVAVSEIVANTLARRNAANPERTDDLENEELEEGFVAVPMLRIAASAGHGRFADDDLRSGQVVAFREDWLRSVGLTPGRTHALTAVGDSMEPTIRDGDLLLVDRSVDRVMNDGIYVVVFANAVLVKRVQIRRDHSVALKSENRTYTEEIVPADEVDSLVVEGRVRWFGRAI